MNNNDMVSYASDVDNDDDEVVCLSQRTTLGDLKGLPINLYLLYANAKKANWNIYNLYQMTALRSSWTVLMLEFSIVLCNTTQVMCLLFLLELRTENSEKVQGKSKTTTVISK